MSRTPDKPVSSRKHVASYRQRMRLAGLRRVEIWLPDPRAPGFAAKCRQQARAIAAGDPAGDEIMRFVEGVRDWSEG